MKEKEKHTTIEAPLSKKVMASLYMPSLEGGSQLFGQQKVHFKNEKKK